MLDIDVVAGITTMVCWASIYCYAPLSMPIMPFPIPSMPYRDENVVAFPVNQLFCLLWDSYLQKLVTRVPQLVDEIPAF